MICCYKHKCADLDQWSTYSDTMCSGAWRASADGFKALSGTPAFHQRIISSDSYAHGKQGNNPGQEK